MDTALRTLGLAASYFLAGKLALLLAIPPGYATAIWPAAGVALAGVLHWGYRVWPGIAVGSFLVNVWTSFDMARPFEAVGLPATIGAGAALQAVVGAWLVRRSLAFPTALNDEKDIVKFLFLGGPVSCLVCATVGVGSLVLWGNVPPLGFAFSWLTWWVGDTIGVLIATPLLILWTAEPRATWRRRRIFVAVPLLSALALSVVFFLLTSAAEERRIRSEFGGHAAALADAIDARLSSYVEVMDGFQWLFDDVSRVDHDRFQRFAGRKLARYPELQAIEWAPRVAEASRETFEESVRRTHPTFEILERGAAGELARASSRPEYVPVYYVEPYRGNEKALGLDHASEPARREALERARDTGEMTLTAPLRLVRTMERKKGTLLIMPVYSRASPRDTIEVRRRDLRGYVVGVLRVGDVIEAALDELEQTESELVLRDNTLPGLSEIIYETRELVRPNGDARQSVPTTIPLKAPGGRRWALDLTPTLAYSLGHRSWEAWGFLVAALVFTGALGAFLLVVTGRSAVIEQAVADRTAELRQSEFLLREAQAMAQIGSWRWDVGRNALTWSEELYLIYGVSPGEFTPTYESYLAMVTPEHRDEVRRAVERALSTREPFEREYEIIRPTGQIRRVHARGAVLLGPDGAVTSVSGTCQDITERKKAEEARHASEGQAQLILEAAFDAFISIDSEGRIIEWNRQAEATFGWSRSEAIGRPLAETVIPPSYLAAHKRGLQHFLETGEGPALNKRIEIEALHRDGHEFPVELTISSMKVGERLMFSAFLHDITERKEMVAALSASIEDKEALLKEVHHRVKNNLQIVSSLLSLQAATLEDPQARAVIAESQGRVRAMSMVHEALEQSDNPARVNFGEYLKNLMSELRRSYAADSDRVRFAVHVEPVLLRLDSAVPCALITTELVTNSFKHAFPGGAAGDVEVSFRRVEDGLFTLSVEDNGTGLPEGIEPGRSSSLGLRLVHRLATQIGATVSFERLSRGTRIALTFKDLSPRTREEIPA
jgi:PAS domain S-box-containing protein